MAKKQTKKPSKYMMNFILGDYYDDGHGRYKTFLVESKIPMNEVEGYLRNQINGMIDPETFIETIGRSGYRRPKLEEHIDWLKACGFLKSLKVPKGWEDDPHFELSDFIKYLCFYVNIQNPRAKMKLIPPLPFKELGGYELLMP